MDVKKVNSFRVALILCLTVADLVSDVGCGLLTSDMRDPSGSCTGVHGTSLTDMVTDGPSI